MGNLVVITDRPPEVAHGCTYEFVPADPVVAQAEIRGRRLQRASSSAEGTRSSISICSSLYFSFSFLPTHLFSSSQHRKPHSPRLGTRKFRFSTLLFFRRQLPNRIQKKKLSVKWSRLCTKWKRLPLHNLEIFHPNQLHLIKYFYLEYYTLIRIRL